MQTPDETILLYKVDERGIVLTPAIAERAILLRRLAAAMSSKSTDRRTA